MDYEEIEIRKRIEEAKKTKYCAKQQMAEADIEIGKYDLQLLELNKQKEADIEEEIAQSNEIPTLLKYAPSAIRTAPRLIDVTNTGAIIIGASHDNTRVSPQYDIFTFLWIRDNLDILMEMQRNKKNCFRYVANKFHDFSHVTSEKIVYLVDSGNADFLFEKWAKIQKGKHIPLDEFGQII